MDLILRKSYFWPKTQPPPTHTHMIFITRNMFFILLLFNLKLLWIKKFCQDEMKETIILNFQKLLTKKGKVENHQINLTKFKTASLLSFSAATFSSGSYGHQPQPLPMRWIKREHYTGAKDQKTPLPHISTSIVNKL